MITHHYPGYEPVTHFYEMSSSITVRVWGPCVITGAMCEAKVPLAEWEVFRDPADRGLIQQQLPSVPAPAREFLKTGISPDGWAVLFPPEPQPH